MIYADTDFFLALLKPKDWLKEGAKKLLEKYKGEITTSVITFVELMLLAKRYELDPIELTSSVMALCNIDDERLLRAAICIKEHNINVFDAFHAAYCGDTIISSDTIFEKLGIKRIRLESPDLD